MPNSWEINEVTMDQVSPLVRGLTGHKCVAEEAVKCSEILRVSDGDQDPNTGRACCVGGAAGSAF